MGSISTNIDKSLNDLKITVKTMRLKDLVDLILPEYLVSIFLAVISSALILSKNPNPLGVLFSLLSVSFGIFGLNSLNNVLDLAIDKKIKPLRPLPAGKLTVRFVLLFSSICFVLSVCISALINQQAFFYGLLFTVLAIAYSAPPIRLKKFLFSANFVGAILYGAIPFLLVQQAIGISSQLPFLVFFTGLIFAIASVKDFEDVEEKKAGVKTLPNVYGMRAAAYFTISLLFLILSMIALSLIGIIDFKFIFSGLISLFLLFPFSVKFFKLIKEIDPKKIVTQSKLITYSMGLVGLVQLIYALTNILL